MLAEFVVEKDPDAVDLDKDSEATDVDSDATDVDSDANASGDDGEEDVIKTGGRMLNVYWLQDFDDLDLYDPMIAWRSKTVKDRRAPELCTIDYNKDLVRFVVNMQDILEEALGLDEDSYDMPIYTEHTRNGLVFRGHPDFRGTGPWRDWAVINWGDPDEGGYGDLPCQIWCFVMVEGLNEKLEDGEQGPKCGGIHLEDGTYAVVETGKWDADLHEITMSDLFQPFFKVLGNGPKKRRFWLADVDAIVDPMCVVPDIGCKGNRNRYFHVKPRSDWAELFIGWLEDPHDLDKRD